MLLYFCTLLYVVCLQFPSGSAVLSVPDFTVNLQPSSMLFVDGGQRFRS